LPVATSVSGFYGNKDDEEVLFNFESYTIPKVVYKFNINTFKKELTKHTAVSFDFKNIEYKEVECLSSDSVRIPMVLVYRKGLVLDGSNPTILSAYGGFGAISQPLFNPGIVYFVNNGGVYAFANIRGGGDKGINWALAGRGDNKQKSFDDFITAAEFLIENKYTNSQKLAATGGSNGGLVVAAAAIQRPDLFKVVVPIVAPFDMIRFENFTIGHFHSDEYGTVSDSSSFQKLYSYSPYHNIKEDVNYPTMLVITSENDDRVPPFHSYKFVAKLQSRVAQKNPIILKVREKAGHNGATSFRANLREKAELYGFILNELQNK
jgi:prolyl oligopeptidase